MTANNPSAQMSFLMDAAHLLRQSAPETSAYLMSRRNEMSLQQQMNTSDPAPMLSDAQRQRLCTCCGHIMIPGMNGTTVKIQSGRQTDKLRAKQEREKARISGLQEKTKTGKATTTRPRSGIQKVFTCGFCGRDTWIALPPAPPLPKNRKKLAAEPKAADPKATAAPGKAGSANATTTTAKPSTSANASSKKRAKNRKAGLLAMLGNKSASSSGFGSPGLSFNDFRKK